VKRRDEWLKPTVLAEREGMPVGRLYAMTHKYRDRHFVSSNGLINATYLYHVWDFKEMLEKELQDLYFSLTVYTNPFRLSREIADRLGCSRVSVNVYLASTMWATRPSSLTRITISTIAISLVRTMRRILSDFKQHNLVLLQDKDIK